MQSRSLLASLCFACAVLPGAALGANLVDTISQRPDLAKFTAAIRATGLDKDLASGKKFTIFAPTDAAIDALPSGQWSGLLEPKSKNELLGLLKRHVVRGNYTSQRLVTAKAARYDVPSLDKSAVRIDRRKSLKASDVALYHLDVTADNGTIHIIDKLLHGGRVARVAAAKR